MKLHRNETQKGIAKGFVQDERVTFTSLNIRRKEDIDPYTWKRFQKQEKIARGQISFTVTSYPDKWRHTERTWNNWCKSYAKFLNWDVYAVFLFADKCSFILL